MVRDRHNHSRRLGFTLIEAGISVAIVGVLVIAALTTFGATAKAQVVQKDRTRAVRLARDLLVEVLQRPYQDPQGDNGLLGLDAGETSRASFDDVDDYHGYVQQLIVTKDDTAVSGFEGWSRKVKVRWVEAGASLNFLSSETGLKQITVTVTNPAGLTTEISGLRSRYSAFENQPLNRVTYISGVTITIEGKPGLRTTINTAAATLNQIPH